jgi:hypothetical protein
MVPVFRGSFPFGKGPEGDRAAVTHFLLHEAIHYGQRYDGNE